MIRIIDDIELAKRTILRRRPIGQVEAPPALAAAIRHIFGMELMPSEAVEHILQEVRARGDAALHEYNRRIDGVQLPCLEVTTAEVELACRHANKDVLEALSLAVERLRAFHLRQCRNSWMEWSAGGGMGQMVRPLERVGIYVPGGRAAYPSSLLMAAVPARVAGVKELIVTSPPAADGRLSESVLTAARLAGVNRIFKVGGAQAIAALAYGTESVPRVDKIVGPGNLFVVLAKRKVFGDVDIDQLPGPTETLIIADGGANPTFVAADLLAQAEHDPLASAILITDSPELAQSVSRALEAQLAELTRASIAAESLQSNGGIILVAEWNQAVELANCYAPEHLCLLTREPWNLLGKIQHAGGIFVGEYSPETIGDYIAGPSHIMPTGGTARFFSPLSVDDFVKTISVVALTREEFKRLGPPAAILAEAEGLTAHAMAVRRRLEH
ncbi:MAG: histidinol dehydrogenase [Chloroflexi bacterium]|nr:histidinol dehydrogenase [Chloroflexota bacterium]